MAANNRSQKPRIAVHKFTSCDGCQLAFLNMGEALLTLAENVEIVHFAEAGFIDAKAKVDIAFVEGSVSTPDEQKRIKMIRNNCNTLVSIGACATSGGIQALRNAADTKQWVADVYASPEFISSLDTATAIANHVKVDFELWGCPVNSKQLIKAIRAYLFGVLPHREQDKVCLECKRQHNTCVVITKRLPCMGPVTVTGCGAICPKHGRDCYACYGPAENVNTRSLSRCFEGLGLTPDVIEKKFHLINSASPEFRITKE